jgi:hypothetical protein
MGYILVIWTAVAASGYMGWRPVGEFETQKLCQDAGQQLTPTYRCLKQKDAAK